MTRPKEKIRFALLRHAQTQWNVAKRIQGTQDSPLTEYGCSQAAGYAARLQPMGFTAVLASDLGRAVQTAEIINAYLKLPLAKDPRLREQDWGRWSGSTLAHLRRMQKEMLERQVAAGWGFCAPEGETRRAVFLRACAALEAWAETGRHAGTLVITHEGVIRCLLYGLSGRAFLPSEPALVRPEHLHWLVYNGENLLIEQINALNLNQEISP